MALVVTIFSAVQTEAKAIAKAVSAPVPIPSLPVHSTYGSIKIIHHLIGIKAVGLQNLSIGSDTGYILLAGLAGALDPSLAVGDLVLCDCPETLSTRLEIQRGLIHTGLDLAATPNQKAELFASSQARIVDMETAIVRAFAARRDILFVCLRAVSDSAHDRLDPKLLRIIDQWGKPRFSGVMEYLSGNLFRLFTLLRLARHSALATRHLQQGVLTVLDAIASTPL